MDSNELTSPTEHKQETPLVVTRLGYNEDKREFTVESVLLRDFFAAFALTGLIAQADRTRAAGAVAKEAYAAADAMLAVRAEQPEGK